MEITAENFIETLSANVDNEKLSDKDFREMIRNTIPIVKGFLVPLHSPSQSKDIVCKRDNSDNFSY